MKKILAIFLMTALLVVPAFASAEVDETADTQSAGISDDVIAEVADAIAEATAISDDTIAEIADAIAEAVAEAIPETEPEAACNHYITVEEEPATCTEKGLRTYECTECGWSLTIETLPTGVHNYVASEKAATCTEDGVITYTCSMCGDSYEEVVPATGHVPSTTDPACDEDVVCTVCGEVLEPAVGHAYTYQYDAEINEDGSYASYGTWVCDNCGDVIEATEGNAEYYYGLLEEGASDESSAEVVELSDPQTAMWTTIEIIVVVVFIVEGVVLMLSFGRKKKTEE